MDFNNSTYLTPPAGSRKAVIYVRISDPKQLTKGDGIHSQETTCREFARFNGFEVVEVFRDVISGKYANRDGMEEMIAFLKARKDQNIVVIIDEVSRLARDYVGHFSLREAIRLAGGEMMSPSHKFTDDPTQQMPEKIMAVIKEQERIDNAARVLRRSKARMKAGFYVFAAPRGYKYVKDTNKQRGGKILVRDEPVASVVQDALEKFSTGVLSSLVEFSRYLEAHPDVPKGVSGKIGKDRARAMITQPLYASFIEHKPWGIPLTKAQHERLISFDTYRRNQDRLAGRTKSFPVRLDINPEFPLRGLVNCAGCGEPLKGAKSKGRSKYYSYYACHTKGCEHYGKSIKKAKIEGEFEDLLETLRPSQGLIEIATHMFTSLWDKHHASFKERQDAAKRSLRGIEKKIENLVGRIVNTTQPVLIAAYEGKLTKLDSRRIALAEEIERLSDETGPEAPRFESAYRTTMEFLANPCFLWRSSHVGHKRAAVKLCFGGDLTYDRNEGYRTAQTSEIFTIFQRLKGNPEEENMENRAMVGDTGIEPVTPTMSTNTTDAK